MNPRHILSRGLLLASICTLGVSAQTVPYLINYQGMVTAGGEAFDGTGHFSSHW